MSRFLSLCHVIASWASSQRPRGTLIRLVTFSILSPLEICLRFPNDDPTLKEILVVFWLVVARLGVSTCEWQPIGDIKRISVRLRHEWTQSGYWWTGLNPIIPKTRMINVQFLVTIFRYYQADNDKNVENHQQRKSWDLLQKSNFVLEREYYYDSRDLKPVLIKSLFTVVPQIILCRLLRALPGKWVSK